MIEAYKIPEHLANELRNEFWTDNVFFNPMEDANGNFVIFELEYESLSSERKALCEVIEYEPIENDDEIF